MSQKWVRWQDQYNLLQRLGITGMMLGPGKQFVCMRQFGTEIINESGNRAVLSYFRVYLVCSVTAMVLGPEGSWARAPWTVPRNLSLEVTFASHGLGIPAFATRLSTRG